MSSADPPWRIVPLAYGFAVQHPDVEVAIWAETLEQATRIAATPPRYVDAALRSSR